MNYFKKEKPIYERPTWEETRQQTDSFRAYAKDAQDDTLHYTAAEFMPEFI